MLRAGEICHTGSWNSKEKLLCSVVSFGPKSATVRLWEGRDFNKVVTVPFTSGKYLQPVKGGPKSACAKRILKGKVYSQMNDSALKEHLQHLSQQQLSKTKTTKTTLSTDARDDETNGTTDEAVMEEAEEEAFDLIPCWFTEKGKHGDFEDMIKKKEYVEKGGFLFNDNLRAKADFVQHRGGRDPGAGNGVIRPFQHKDKGEHAVGVVTGPNFHSLHHIFPTFDDGAEEPLLTVGETLELSFAHILFYLYQHPEKKKLYYSAATGSTKLGLGIFAACTGEDVIDYASAILLKIPEMVVEMRKAELHLDASLMPQLAKIVRKKVRDIFVGERALIVNTAPPLVYKYLDPALLDEARRDHLGAVLRICNASGHT